VMSLNPFHLLMRAPCTLGDEVQATPLLARQSDSDKDCRDKSSHADGDLTWRPQTVFFLER